jgi:hypothetical protein
MVCALTDKQKTVANIPTLTQLARLGGSFCDFARARVNLIKGLG